ncbi:MAG: YihY/virulence factor BrkB family protein [Burkholderiales bacterium]|nr:YihY/virulence factor BrkB family protein [Bacteroidia bacterium]
MSKLTLKNFGGILKITFKKWYKRDPFRESAVIAYNAIFSLPGLMVVIITLAGYFFGQEIVSGELHKQISGMMGPDTADQVKKMIVSANKGSESIWATILGVLTIIVGATGVFVQLQKSLNNIWEVKEATSKSGIFKFFSTRLFSFGLILSIAFLLLVSLVLSSVLAALGNWISGNRSDAILFVFKITNFVLSLVIITVLFALMFKILPDVKIKWHLVWVGSFFTALFFVLGKSALGLYFGKAEPGSGYGAAGSVILILLWTSYSSMILFFGAEFTKAYSDHYYGEVSPSENSLNKLSTNNHG